MVSLRKLFMMNSDKKNIVIWASFMVLTLAWGSSFILIKRALQGGFTPYEVASVRMLSAFVVLLIPSLNHLKHIPKPKMGYLVLSGWLSMFIPALLFSTAQVYIKESSIVSILNALTPAFTFIIGILMFRQPFIKLQMLGLVIGFLGSSLLILVNAKGQLSFNHYTLLVLLASMCYGTNVNLVKQKLADVKSIHLSTFTVAIAGLSGLAYLIISGTMPHLISTAITQPYAFGAMFLLGAMGTAFAQIIFNHLLSITSSVFASAITYFIPIVALFWGILDGEQLSMWHFVGMGCIIGGIFILNKFK